MERKRFNLNVKKRLMFSKDDDYYFIAYNSLVFLHATGCTDETAAFKDYTKLAYLIPLIADSTLLDSLVSCKEQHRIPSNYEKMQMQDLYLQAHLRRKLLASIVFALESKNYIFLQKGTRKGSIDIWLNESNISSSYFDSKWFEVVRSGSK